MAAELRSRRRGLIARAQREQMFVTGSLLICCVTTQWRLKRRVQPSPLNAQPRSHVQAKWQSSVRYTQRHATAYGATCSVMKRAHCLGHAVESGQGRAVRVIQCSSYEIGSRKKKRNRGGGCDKEQSMIMQGWLSCSTDAFTFGLV